MKSGYFNFLEPSGPLQACNGTALPLPLPYYIERHECSKSQDDVLRVSVRTKDLTHYSCLLLQWFLSRENLRFIPVSEITLELQKSYRTKYFYKSIYLRCTAGYYVGIFHHILLGCLEYC